jgi:hypothetical protein
VKKKKKMVRTCFKIGQRKNSKRVQNVETKGTCPRGRSEWEQIRKDVMQKEGKIFQEIEAEF